MKALPTTYKGITFRSRLEARWAAFFENINLRWEYEPEGFDTGRGWYLPDFRVKYPGVGAREQHFEWFEVKPSLLDIDQDEWRKMLAFHEQKGLTILDGPPAYRGYCDVRMALGLWWNHPEINWDEDFKPDDEALSDRRFGYLLWGHKGRLWWDEHEQIIDWLDTSRRYGDGSAVINEYACRQANALRFERKK